MFSVDKKILFSKAYCVCSCTMKDLELIVICCSPLSRHLVPRLTYPPSAVSMVTEVEKEHFNKYEDVTSLNYAQVFGMEEDGSVERGIGSAEPGSENDLG